MKKLRRYLSLPLALVCLILTLSSSALAAPANEQQSEPQLDDLWATLLTVAESDDGATLTYTNVATSAEQLLSETEGVNHETIFAALCSYIGVENMAYLPREDGASYTDETYIQDMLSASSIAVTTHTSGGYDFTTITATLPGQGEPRYLVEVRLHTTGIHSTFFLRNYTFKLTQNGTFDPDYDIFASTHLYLIQPESGEVATARYDDTTQPTNTDITLITNKPNSLSMRFPSISMAFPSELELTAYLRCVATFSDPPAPEASISVNYDIPIALIAMPILAIACIIWLVARKRTGADVRARRL